MKELLSEISVNTRYMLLFLLALVFSSLIVLEFVLPLRAETAKAESQLQQANAKLAAIQTFAGQNKDYAPFLKLQTLKLEEAKKKLPDTVTVPELVSEYARLASVNGLSLDSLKPPAEVKAEKSGVFPLPLKMTVSGDYFKLVEFLQQIENGTRFTNIKTVDFAADNKGLLKMNADFTVYTLKNPKPPAKAAPKTAAPAK